MLINAGADVNQNVNVGRTLVIRFAMNGHSRIVSFLLSHGARIENKTHLGLIALYLAAIKGH